MAKDKKNKMKIERHKYSIIVYEENNFRGITLPKNKGTNMNLYFEELQSRAKFIKPGVVLMPILFDQKYTESCRPMMLFLKDNNGSFKEDSTVLKLFEFFFKNAIPQISPLGVTYIFCK